jgi:NADPH:quinone reductase-like Zn-dependent oxidoreductase
VLGVRAAIIDELGGPPRCGEVDAPRETSTTTTVEVSAAALNPIDLRLASGSWHGPAPAPPYVPGCEGVGRLSDGSRVWFMAPANQGSFAERCVIDVEHSVELPEGLQDTLAACLGVAGLAAWLALEWRARLQPGETVLVLGASGPVGLFAVQIAKLLGAGRVVAAARDPEGLDKALALGADAAVNIAQVDDLARAFADAAGGGGAHVTIDPLWGAPAAAALAAAAHGGRHVQLGQSAGAEATLTSAAMRGKGLALLGFSNFEVPAADLRDAYRKLAGHAAAQRLRIEHERYPLERVAEAWERQRKGAHRKLVLTP